MKSILFGTKMSLHQLLSLHAESRGAITQSEGEADIAVRWDDFVTDYARSAAFMTF